MALTLSEVFIPTFTKGLTTLSHILTVAQEHAKAHNLDADAEYPGARLIDDMRPLSFQVQVCATTARRTVLVLEGKADDKPWDKAELQTVADLQARIAKAQAALAAADRGLIDASADRLVEV